MMLVIIFEQIFLLYVDAGGRSLLIGDCLENCWLTTSNSCAIYCYCLDTIVQGSATPGTRATGGTREDFLWHAK